MTIDVKLLILYAIYAEYQKDLPDMESVNAQALQMDSRMFGAAMMKLQNEELITGARFEFVKQSPYPAYVFMDRVAPTKSAIDLVERDLQITGRTGGEKAQSLLKRFRDYSWDALTDFAAKVLVEIGKQSIK